MVVVTTFSVGYGDATPITLLGRTIVAFAMAYSILYLSTVTAIFCDAVVFNHKDKKIFLQMEEEQWQFQNAKAAAIVIQRLWRGQNPSVKLRSFALQRHKYRKWRERVYGEKCWNYLKPGEQPDNGEEAELRKTQSKLDQIESMTNSYVAEQARLREESVQKLQRVQNYLEFMQTTVGNCFNAQSKTCQRLNQPGSMSELQQESRKAASILTTDELKLIEHIRTVHQEVLSDGSSKELKEQKIQLLTEAFYATVELIHAIEPRLEQLDGAIMQNRKQLARIR